jgi:signal peptidase I
VAECVVTILIFYFATNTLVQAYVIPTGSMEDNLLVGDHVLVDKVAYADPGGFGKDLLPYRNVRRGDIIVFRYPLDPRQTYVKRVIGVPGDCIHMENRQVIRNGRRLIEPYAKHVVQWIDPYRDNFPQSAPPALPARARDMLERHQWNGEIIVPAGSLFALGDNREDSADSRYWGFVPRKDVIGKPLVVYWSYDAPTEDLMDWNVNHLVDVGLHFFTRTRWERTLLLPRSQTAEAN